MTFKRMTPAFATLLTSVALTLSTAVLLVTSSGCRSGNRAMAPASAIVVVGTLVEIEDGRAYHGGVDLMLETTRGVREVARVPSVFRKPPIESVLAMHAVVNAAKLGDRLRARGTRDEAGALWAETLEIVLP